ncbi:MAG: agmatine deiminase family protein [Chitinophagales bacterium]|nr:agmatine deiminase family protein [Chitinophagales bacterium]
MISDRDTNTIYFSTLLKTDSRFSETLKQIISTLDTFGAKYKFLPDTKDIWVRDFMPIQINDNKFVEYRYDPDYLQGNCKGSRDLKTYPDIVCNSINLSTEKSDLIMDGGNFVKSSDCVILTEKIATENRFFYSKTNLIKKIQDTFQVDKIVLIPQDKLDEYGHSDGMLRFMDKDTVLINHYYKNDSVMQGRLKKAGLKTEFIEYKVNKRDKRNWAYLNFLQTKDFILLPKFGIDEDNQAYQQIEKFYSEYKGKIAQINMTDIVRFGGALNCISWTTKE